MIQLSVLSTYPELFLLFNCIILTIVWIQSDIPLLLALQELFLMQDGRLIAYLIFIDH